MSTPLTGKVVLITGASSGIGAALARECHRQGAKLALLARRTERLEALARDFSHAGGEALVVPADVTRETDLARAVGEVRNHFGKIDWVIANAGFGVAGKLEDLELADYTRQFETNIYGVIKTIYATLEDLKKSRGHLALMGSVSGHLSIGGLSAYSMSKAAVRALGEALAQELRYHGIRVTLISPGFVESEIRHVNNRGEYRPGEAAPLPGWIVMPAEVAARKMVRAIRRGQTEAVITWHGKILVFIQRFFPWFIRLAGRLGVKGRPEPKYRT